MYIECPGSYLLNTKKQSVFLAGGITGCNNWQQEIVDILDDDEIIIYNPRRKDFPIDDPSSAEAQIKWEYHHMRVADTILFWFPGETMCPITLYELGTWSVSFNKPIFIGVHPEYIRKQDVIIQTKLIRPDVKIVSTIPMLAQQVFSHFHLCA